MKKAFILIPVLALALSCCHDRQAPEKGPAYSSSIQKEALGRGLVAIHNGDGKVSVAWRYLESDPLDAAFDLYRSTAGANPVKLNDKPISGSTFFSDSGVDTTVDNVYKVCPAGKDVSENGSTYELTSARASKPYLEIPMASVPGFEDGTYSPNDASVADLDGDGEYEIVVKMETRGFDNAHRGLCTEGNIIDAYKLDGTHLWRVNLGLNIRQGAHYTQMSVYDFDGDGKAEVAVKTAEGTVFGDGTMIGDVNGDGRTDYRNTDPESRTYGFILEGPEFLSVIEGTTGKELARADFIERGGKFEYGDEGGNRVDRYLGGAGYFDGKRPSILICRGYYAKTVLEAWDWRDGKLTKRWRFDTFADGNKYAKYEGQGAHNLRIGDVDGDGKDEIVYGACLIDHDGTGVYTTERGHGDAMHLSDLIVDRPGLEVWMSHEDSPNPAGSEMRDAATGELIWGFPSIQDVGRGLAADIDPRFRGAEAWSSGTDGTYTSEGRFITKEKPSVNFAIWWDGDLNRELLDGFTVRPELTPAMLQKMDLMRQGKIPADPAFFAMTQGNRYMRISKWNGNGVDYFTLPGEEECSVNNGSKSNPAISCDLFGDWREELVVRTSDNRNLRIYMTDIPTEYRFHTLMSDIIYRMSVLAENVTYNQPPEPSFALGSDLEKLWPRKLVASSNGGLHTKGAAGMNARMEGVEEQKIENITVYKDDADSYTLDSYIKYDSCEWTVDGKIAGTGKTCVITPAKYGYDRPVSVSVKAVMKGQIFTDSGTVTFSSENNPRKGYWSDRDRARKGDWGF